MRRFRKSLRWLEDAIFDQVRFNVVAHRGDTSCSWLGSLQNPKFGKGTSSTGRCLYSDDGKRIPKDELVIQKYLNMMQTVLLELYAGENVHVGHVPVQFFQLKLDVRFGHQLNFLDTKDARSL